MAISTAPVIRADKKEGDKVVEGVKKRAIESHEDPAEGGGAGAHFFLWKQQGVARFPGLNSHLFEHIGASSLFVHLLSVPSGKVVWPAGQKTHNLPARLASGSRS